MNNSYQVKGTITEIYITKRGGKTFAVIIDTEDLNRVLLVNANLIVKEDAYGVWVSFSRKYQVGLQRFSLDAPKGSSVIFADGDRLNNSKTNIRLWEKTDRVDHNIEGHRSGMLVAKTPTNTLTEQGDMIWECQCDCGGTRNVNARVIMSNHIKSCGCKRKGAANTRYKGYQELTGRYLGNLKSGASLRNLEWNITPEFLYLLLGSQNYKCALSGRLIAFGNPTQTASLDRIDSTAGYTTSNVQWVHKDVNRMKMNFTEEYFISTCAEITANRRSLDTVH